MKKTVFLRNLGEYALDPVSYFMKRFDHNFYMGMHRHSYFEIMYAHEGAFTLEIYNGKDSPPPRNNALFPKRRTRPKRT